MPFLWFHIQDWACSVQAGKNSNNVINLSPLQAKEFVNNGNLHGDNI